MRTIIEELGALLRNQRGFSIQNDENVLLARYSFGKRSQTVKVTCLLVEQLSFRLLKLQSRVSSAGDYRIVLDALKLNASQEWGGLAFDNSVQPPAIDVVYSLPADGVAPQSLMTAIIRVASFADRLEQQTQGSDLY